MNGKKLYQVFLDGLPKDLGNEELDAA